MATGKHKRAWNWTPRAYRLGNALLYLLLLGVLTLALYTLWLGHSVLGT